MVLRSPGVEWEIVPDGIHQTARAVIDPSDGACVLELRCGTEDLAESPVDEDSRRERAEGCWSDWIATLTLPSLKPELMKRSALTLRGLVHADTGAIMAAATTSLPEEIGGVRNWDLPLVLDPRRRDDRVGTGFTGLDSRGRGISEQAARRD